MHPIKSIIKDKRGVVSNCTANKIVLEAIMENAAENGDFVLVEATANQVNQFGGYTGMQPHDFVSFIRDIAKKSNVDENKVILGGDHLGPLTWKNEPESSAMEKAKNLVKAFVNAGFTKIHLDTSMRLADDSRAEQLSTETIAGRGAVLAQVAMSEWTERKKSFPNADELIFIIGSEVPVPGGAQEDEEGISVTTPDDFSNTVSVYKSVFYGAGLEEAWRNVIGVVVQPGVEFSDNVVFQYNRINAKKLSDKLSKYPNLVFEGHSTDYQTYDSLKAMVEDGIRIQKVGPELTFALREALLAAERIEEELLPEEKCSGFRKTLDGVMCANPEYWKQYYHGSESEQMHARMFSLSDRCRYYLGYEAVENAIEQLFVNLDEIHVPLGIMHQYFPTLSEQLLSGKKLSTRELVKLYIKEGVIKKYRKAISL